MRRSLPVAISVVSGMLYILGNGQIFPSIKTELDKWFLISTAFAVMLSIINLTLVHTKTMQQKPQNRVYSAALLICMYGVIVLGVLESNAGPNYKWVFNNSVVPLEAAVLSTVCFYIVSASYRVFRVRSLEASLMLIATVFVMLGNVPIGEAIWRNFPVIGKWLLAIPNTAAMRAITIGATLGGSATAIRILLGFERGHLGMRD